jgi:hypothetical protein
VGLEADPSAPTFAIAQAPLRTFARIHNGRHCCRLNIHSTSAPWTATMATHIHTLLGIDKLGRKGLSLLINSLAPTTYANYYSNLRNSFTMCLEENIHPLHAKSPATMVCFITWFCLYETIATATLQPYFSTVNKFVRDHQHEPIAAGKLLVDATLARTSPRTTH